MRRQIEGKLGDAPAPVEIVDASVEALPFGDATFDTVDRDARAVRGRAIPPPRSTRSRVC